MFVCAECVPAVRDDDLAAKENELDRLLDVCSSSITTLTKNVSSTQYPLSYIFILLFLLLSCEE